MIIPINYNLADDAELSAALAKHEAEEHSMPCDSITTQTISGGLSKAVVPVLLEALKALGWTVTASDTASITASKGLQKITWAAGTGVTVSAGNPQAVYSEIVRAYSKAAVSWAAQRAGWTVKATGENKMTITRR